MMCAIVSVLVIAMSPVVRAESNRYVQSFNPYGGETGTLYSGNIASTYSVDSNPIVVNETVVYNAMVIEGFAIPNEDFGTDAWTHFGCGGNAFECIDDGNGTSDGDGDTTYIEEFATFGLPTGVRLSSVVPLDALIVAAEPFLLVRGRTTAAGTDNVNVEVRWGLVFCQDVLFSFTSESYVNVGQSLPDCDATNQQWNATMLNDLIIIFTANGNPNELRITMAYVRLHYRTVLYQSAIGWGFQFTDLLANRVNRLVWNCTHVGDTFLSMSLTTPPSPSSRIIIFSGMCEGVNEDSFAPLSATDIDGGTGDIVVVISGNNATVPGYITLDQIIVVMNATGTTSLASFGGSLCWLIGGGLLVALMITVIVIKKRKGRGE